MTLEQRWGRAPRLVSVVIVAVLHAGILYALITGLGTRNVEVAVAPIETNIIEEAKPPPPDLPSPPPPPRLAAPPPPYIPPPEIRILQPPPPQAPIAVVNTVRPPAPIMPPVASAQPAPAPAPVPDSEVSARPIAGPPLVYPPRMEQTGREGRVDIACDVETDGGTSNCAITAAMGGDAFAEAAMTYVQRARYKPAIRNGVPIREQHHTFHIIFRLKD